MHSPNRLVNHLQVTVSSLTVSFIKPTQLGKLTFTEDGQARQRQQLARLNNRVSFEQFQVAREQGGAERIASTPLRANRTSLWEWFGPVSVLAREASR